MTSVCVRACVRVCAARARACVCVITVSMLKRLNVVSEAERHQHNRDDTADQ